MRDDEEHHQNSPPPGSLADTFNIHGVIGGLLTDLENLRSGKITPRQARASAELGKVAIQGMRVMLTAQRMLIESAKDVPATQDPPSPRGQIEGHTDG